VPPKVQGWIDALAKGQTLAKGNLKALGAWLKANLPGALKP
jgi:hypothetical protein